MDASVASLVWRMGWRDGSWQVSQGWTWTGRYWLANFSSRPLKYPGPHVLCTDMDHPTVEMGWIDTGVSCGMGARRSKRSLRRTGSMAGVLDTGQDRDRFQRQSSSATFGRQSRRVSDNPNQRD
jgi:hypothetical protein